MSDNTNSAQERTASIDLAQLDKTDPLRDAGQRMANVMYNMAQRVGYTLTEQDAENLRSLHQKWDAAALARRSLTSGAPEALSYADAAQWARDNGLKVPDAWLVGAAAPSAEQGLPPLPEYELLTIRQDMVGSQLAGYRDEHVRQYGEACAQAALRISAGAAAKTEQAPKPSFFVIVDAQRRAEYVTMLADEAQEHINDACSEGVESAGKWKAIPVFEMRPSDDHLWEQTLRDRDTYLEWADKLAEAIATHFGAEIGEHSNMNCPWAEALEVIESATAAGAGSETRIHLWWRQDHAEWRECAPDATGAVEFIGKVPAGYRGAWGAAGAGSAQARKFNAQTIKPLLNHWFGSEDRKGLFNSERLLAFANDAIAKSSGAAAKTEQAPSYEYTMDIGIAGDRYYHSFENAHPLPAKWSWNKLWDIMRAAGPATAAGAGSAQPRAEGGSEVSDFELKRLHKLLALLGVSDPETLDSATSMACFWALIQEAINKLSFAPAQPLDDARDAARYRWLRDKSEPGICAFYLSVGQAFKDVKFAPETVDQAIDTQIAAMRANDSAAEGGA